MFHQRQEKEQRDKEEKQNNQESLEVKRESDKIFSEKQQLKAQQIKDDLRKLEDFNARQMVMLKPLPPRLQNSIIKTIIVAVLNLLVVNLFLSNIGSAKCEETAVEKRRRWVSRKDGRTNG